MTRRNSVAAAESTAFAHRWEVWAGDGDAPAEKIAAGARVVEQDDIVACKAPRQEGAEYFALVLTGGRPVACFVDDPEIGAVAEEHGVTVDAAPGSGAPPTVAADGSDEALQDFVLREREADLLGRGPGRRTLRPARAT